MSASADPPVVAGSRREEILIAATQLFAEHGYNAVGMRSIADAVGVRSSSLYHHFPSKTALLAAIAGEYGHDYISDHVPILESSDRPADRLRRVFYDQIVYFWEHRLNRDVGLKELRELEANQHETWERIRSDLRRYQTAVTRTIEEGVSVGEFDVDDPRLAATAAIGMITAVNDWYRPTGRLTIEEVASGYVILIIDRLLGARNTT